MGNSKWNIGVCSWSLRSDIDEVAGTMKDAGINHVHLAVGPAFEEGGEEYLAAVKKQDWIISSTMIGFKQENYSSLDTIKVTGGIIPDDAWPENKALCEKAVALTKELGVEYISTHAGFIDHNDAEKYKVMCDRIKALADAADQNGITFLLETGQETAEDLAAFLRDVNHPAVGINFDPANMILYDKGNPIDALKVLAPWIKHVHIKDALRTETPGTWGKEVPWGDGQVGSDEFLAALGEIGYCGTIAVEREAGDTRVADIKMAVERIKGFINSN